MENESEASKNSVDQIFTDENKKQQAEFLTFFEVYMLSVWNVSWSIGQFLVSLSHIPCKKSEKLPLACLYLKFSLSYGYPQLLLYKTL